MGFIKNTIIVAVLVLIFSACSDKRSVISSPDGNIKLIVKASEGSLFISQLFKGDTIIRKSPIGMKVDGADICKDFKIEKIEKVNFSETWTPVNGKSKHVENSYNELIIHGVSGTENHLKFEVAIRCYDEGFAYRYLIPKQVGVDSIRIEEESSQLSFKEDFTFWAYNGEHHNIGPLRWSESKDTTYRIPVVTKCSNKVYVGIHEAEIIRYAPFNIQKDKSGNTVGIDLKETTDRLPIKTSWRTFIVREKPGDLVNSNLLVNLNEPCKIEDTSWIKPGRAVWDWRVWGYTSVDGFEYGLDTKSHLRFIDFAAENNIQYLLIDADWYGPEFETDSDPTKAREGINIEECMAYAKKKRSWCNSLSE